MLQKPKTFSQLSAGGIALALCTLACGSTTEEPSAPAETDQGDAGIKSGKKGANSTTDGQLRTDAGPHTDTGPIPDPNEPSQGGAGGSGSGAGDSESGAGGSESDALPAAGTTGSSDTGGDTVAGAGGAIAAGGAVGAVTAGGTAVPAMTGGFGGVGNAQAGVRGMIVVGDTGGFGGTISAGGFGGTFSAGGVGGDIGIGGFAGATGVGAGGSVSFAGAAGGGSMVTDQTVPLPAGCSASERPGGDDWCQLNAECDADTRYSYCYQQGERWRCDCEAGDGYSYFELEGSSASNACVKAIEHCASTGDLEYDDSGCSLANASAESTSCQLQDKCERIAQIGDGVELVLVSTPRIDCQETEAGDWLCRCTADETQIQLNVSSTEAFEACQSGIALCEGGSVELSGELTCTTGSQSASTDACSSFSSCTQAGSLLTQEVQAFGSLNTYCQQGAEDDEWICECGAGAEVSQRAVISEAPWDACTTMSEVCATELSLKSNAPTNNGAGGFGNIPPTSGQAGSPGASSAGTVGAGAAGDL